MLRFGATEVTVERIKLRSQRAMNMVTHLLYIIFILSSKISWRENPMPATAISAMRNWDLGNSKTFCPKGLKISVVASVRMRKAFSFIGVIVA